MKKKTLFSCLAVALLIGVSGAPSLAGSGKAASLSSKSIKAGEAVPAVFAAKSVEGGKNLSPELKWEGFPQAKSFAISCIDVNPIAGNYVHWMAVNIPASVFSIPEGASGGGLMPEGCVELENSARGIGWIGPHPGDASLHKYVFTVYALSEERLPVRDVLHFTASSFSRMIEGKVIAKASFTATFKRREAAGK